MTAAAIITAAAPTGTTGAGRIATTAKAVIERNPKAPVNAGAFCFPGGTTHHTLR